MPKRRCERPTASTPVAPLLTWRKREFQKQGAREPELQTPPITSKLCLTKSHKTGHVKFEHTPPLALRNMHAPQSHVRVLARTAGCYAERGNGVSMPPRHGCKYLSHRLRAYRILGFTPAPLTFPTSLPPFHCPSVPCPPPSHFCIRFALSHYRSKSMSSVTVLVSGKPRRAA